MWSGKMKCHSGVTSKISVWFLSLFTDSFLLPQVRFQHEVYPQTQGSSGSTVDHAVSRQVFIVQDLEIRDRLATSQMNKFLYLYSSKEMPRKAHSNMVSLSFNHHI